MAEFSSDVARVDASGLPLMPGDIDELREMLVRNGIPTGQGQENKNKDKDSSDLN